MIFKTNIPVSQFFSEEGGLITDHCNELATNPDKIKLKPDVKRYQDLQDKGFLFNIVGYEDEIMVGYSVIFIMPHMHYMDDKFAMVDVLYTDPLYRNSRLGLDLINKTEELCKEQKVSVLTYHTKPSHNTIEKILYRKGFSHFENIVGKLLKE